MRRRWWTDQGPLDSKNTVMSSLSFLSSSHVQNLKLKKPAPQKCQQAGIVKGLSRSLASLPKGTGKGQARKTENIQKVTFLLQPNVTKTIAHPNSNGEYGPRLPSSQVVRRGLQPPAGMVSEDARREMALSTPRDEMNPPHHRICTGHGISISKLTGQ